MALRFTAEKGHRFDCMTDYAKGVIAPATWRAGKARTFHADCRLRTLRSRGIKTSPQVVRALRKVTQSKGKWRLVARGDGGGGNLTSLDLPWPRFAFCLPADSFRPPSSCRDKTLISGLSGVPERFVPRKIMIKIIINGYRCGCGVRSGSHSSLSFELSVYSFYYEKL